MKEQQRMAIDTASLNHCIQTLEKACAMLEACEECSIDHNVYCCACAKEFDVIVELSDKLLRQRLKNLLDSPKTVERLLPPDILHKAVQHDLLQQEEAQRWQAYRENRTYSRHDDGKAFAEQEKARFPAFIADARALEQVIRAQADRHGQNPH